MSKKPGWLSQVVNKRSQSTVKKDPKEVLNTVPLTEDRRRPSPESGPSLLYMNARSSEAPAEEEQPRVAPEDLKHEKDEIEGPQPEHARGAARRSSKRIRAPLDFYFFVRKDHFVPLELTVIVTQPKMRVVDVFLFDAADRGIGFVSPEEFPVGSEMTICGAHAEDHTPLVAADITILNNRPLPDDKPVPEKFANKPLWIHGTQMSPEDAAVLYKATLDSIGMNVALANTGEPLAEIDAELNDDATEKS